MIENDIKIRDPDIKDLEDIVHINRVCLPENYPIAYFIELIKSFTHIFLCIFLDFFGVV